MLQVVDSSRAQRLIAERFAIHPQISEVALPRADGCVLAADVYADEDIPGFDRSTVDGYAVNASDVFGCSDAIPALMTLGGEVAIGETPDFHWRRGVCFYVPTGGALPLGTDAMVMIEYAERFSDGTVAVYKPSAPGQHIIFCGDDIKQGALAAHSATVVSAREMAALALIGVSQVKVVKRPRVGILSTGDELIPFDQAPRGAQIRDVNGPMLVSAVAAAGGEPVFYGIVSDDVGALRESVERALADCDMLLLSGGTSVGSKDATRVVVEALGEVIIHGIAIKPGKPTIVGDVGGKPIFGLPGHPLAAYFIFEIFVRPLLLALAGRRDEREQIEATLSRAIPSNEGREACIPVRLEGDDAAVATPILGKSGLITTLLGAHGYIRIPREKEGLAKGSRINVTLFGS